MFDASLAELRGRNKQETGLLLSPERIVDETVAGYAKYVDLIAIAFPKFGDGRGYTAARLLRERHGFDGTLRAIGEVLVDQLLFLKRCGFDEFDIASGVKLDSALQAFGRFKAAFYQPM